MDGINGMYPCFPVGTQTEKIGMMFALTAVMAGVMLTPVRVDAQGVQREFPQLQEREENTGAVPVAIIARNGVPTQDRLRGVYMEGGELYLRLYEVRVNDR